MSLKAKIENDLKAAILERRRFDAEVLRNLKAAILNEEVALSKREDGLDDESIEKLIAREVKKRNESAAIYEQANRSELAENEKAEIRVLELYLPEQLSEDEIKNTVNEVISSMGVSDLQAMGKVIGTVKAKLGNSADGAVVARLVKEALS